MRVEFLRKERERKRKKKKHSFAEVFDVEKNKIIFIRKELGIRI